MDRWIGSVAVVRIGLLSCTGYIYFSKLDGVRWGGRGPGFGLG
jgi:hypothetical protein